ncbi:MAG TPA: hypothetical protein DDY29_03180 [Rhodobacteraceae bacterium]|nr:hypothetical protein [Paracoccaceae bacterium]HBG97752.1 hypothetical protein [Paracoccaceae bacterium]
MARAARYFVILAAMRSGSNLLERALAGAPDILTGGELFNPAFVGRQGAVSQFGIDLAARDADPMALLDALRAAAGDDRIAGFRMFLDHDARILAHVLRDPACARIVLRRNPLDRYLSQRLAREDGVWQWAGRRALPEAAKIAFDPSDFVCHVDRNQTYYDAIRRGLAQAGQGALWVNYPDLLDPLTLAGIARFVGSEHPDQAVTSPTRKQNPKPAVTRVTNPLEMARTVLLLDREGMFSRPDFEPARRVGAPPARVARRAGLMYLPIPGAGDDRIAAWLLAHERQRAGRRSAALLDTDAMRPLGRWMRRSPGHLRFAWVAHPLERAYRVLTDQILRPAGASFPRLRRVLARDYGVDLPEIWPSPGFDAAAAHTALIGFLRFVVANHARQTVVNVNARWASQAAWLDGLPSMLRPHHVFRGRRIANGLAFLEVERDLQPIAVTGAGPGADPNAPALGDIHDAELEALARRAFARDYTAFGFSDWSPTEG